MIATESLPEIGNGPRETWKRDRMRGIGASEWSTILGIDPKKSRFALACEKLGEIEPDNLDDLEHIEFGNAMEPVILSFLAKRTGRTVDRWPQDQMAWHPKYSFLFATPDGLQIDPIKGRGVAEAKNRNEWTGREWKDSPPLLVQIQIQAQMEILGLEWGTICTAIGGNRFKWFDVERNQRFIDSAIPALAEFWDLIKAGKKPEIDATPSCTAAIKKLHPNDNGEEIQLPETFDTVYAELKELKSRKSMLESRIEFLNNSVKVAIGPNSYGMLPTGNSFSFLTQNRVKHCPHCKLVVSESEPRVLLQRKPGKKDVRAALLAEYPQNVAKVTAALLSIGAFLRHESERSRYFVLASGFEIRVSDHDPNQNTDRWMSNNNVTSLRLDQPNWREDLQLIVGDIEID